MRYSWPFYDTWHLHDGISKWKHKSCVYLHRKLLNRFGQGYILFFVLRNNKTALKKIARGCSPSKSYK